jgi:hypothetical protein
MPSVEQILNGLQEIVNARGGIAVFWHAYFGAFAVALLLGCRPRRRLAGLLLAPPLLSVSVLAWTARNPFNGIVFALLTLAALGLACKLTCEPARTAPAWFLFPGMALFAFGWAYPHFLETASFLPYLFRAPVGLIPCPTLAIVCGLLLVLDGLGSRALCLVLGVAGLFFGVFGVARLGVAVDWTLLLGSLVLLTRALLRPAS